MFSDQIIVSSLRTETALDEVISIFFPFIYFQVPIAIAPYSLLYTFPTLTAEVASIENDTFSGHSLEGFFSFLTI